MNFPKLKILFIELSFLVCMAGCGSEHKTFDASIPDSGTEDGSDSGTDGPSVTVAQCQGQTGVKVSGTILFSGTAPSSARLWAYWKSPAGGIPPCSMEIKPVVFPANFLFEQVPNQGWSLVAFIDVDGGFPPIPASGDFLVEKPASELDLSADIENLVLEIPTTPLP